MCFLRLIIGCLVFFLLFTLVMVIKQYVVVVLFHLLVY